MTRNAINTSALAYSRRSTQSIMLQVMLALVPGTLLYSALISHTVLVNLTIAVVSALVFEATLVALRKRSIVRTLQDGSIVLAAWLLVLCVPPQLPAWQLVIGTFIMCALGKHVFGGLGHNPFNPAMVAYAMLLVSFPVTMTQWPELSSNDPANQSIAWDSVTGATALDQIKNVKRTMGVNESFVATESDISELVLSSDWLWVNVCWLLGGLYLLARRIISWHIPISILGSVAALYLFSGAISNSIVLPIAPALFSGAILLGAFFIATDPVSAAASNQGKIIYGAGIGTLCFVLREYSVYPEGFAFSVLLMNICVPLIDRLFTRA